MQHNSRKCIQNISLQKSSKWRVSSSNAYYLDVWESLRENCVLRSFTAHKNMFEQYMEYIVVTKMIYWKKERKLSTQPTIRQTSLFVFQIYAKIPSRSSKYLFTENRAILASSNYQRREKAIELAIHRLRALFIPSKLQFLGGNACLCTHRICCYASK